MTNKQEMLLSRGITLVVAVLVIIFAITISDVMEALDIAYALLSGCVFIPVVAGFFWRRATATGAVCSIILSLIVTIICICTFGAFSAATISLGFLSSAIGLVAGSLLSTADIEKIKKWEAMISAPDISEQTRA